MEESKVGLAKNILILGQFYFLLLYSPSFPFNRSKQTIRVMSELRSMKHTLWLVSINVRLNYIIYAKVQGVL